MVKKKEDEFELKFAKEELEHLKGVYETFIKVLVEYGIDDIAYSAIKSRELYEEELKDKFTKDMEEFNNLVINEPAILVYFSFGKSGLTEYQKIDEEIDYYKNLIEQVKYKIKNFPYDIKVKIAKDSVEYGYLWSNNMNDVNVNK